MVRGLQQQIAACEALRLVRSLKTPESVAIQRDFLGPMQHRERALSPCSGPGNIAWTG